MTRASARAVVVGAGIAGISAAMALAGSFDSVLIVERDVDVPTPEPRPGVAQGRQPHLMLCGGLAALRRLFPGIDEPLLAAGAVPYAAGRDLRLETPGLGVLPPRDFDLAGLSMPRAMLESVLMHRVLYETDVRLRAGTRAIAVETSRDGARVTGVALASGGASWIEPADVVVDASGQGLLTLACLRQTGRALPRETAVEVDIGYSSAVFAIPSAALDFVAMMTHADRPASSRAGYVMCVGADRWQVLLVGRGADQPPSSPAGFLAYAEGLGTPTIAGILRFADAPEAFARYRFGASVRRAFGGSGALPAGLLPIGDAICRVNPVYGQGMTVAAQQAVALRDLLRREPSPAALTERFLAACEPLIDRAWQSSVVADFAYPETVGVRPPDLAAQLDAQRDLLEAAMDDAAAHRTLLAALHLVPEIEIRQEADPEPEVEKEPYFSPLLVGYF